MQIDWFTVSAQIVNFLVLVSLLKRFLYRPVLESMSLRERKIEERQQIAEKKIKSAEQIGREYLGKQKELNARRSEMLKHAQNEADQQRAVLLEQLREEIDQIRRNWKADLAKDQMSLMQEMSNAISEKIVKISRQVLGDLAGVDLEQQIVARFLDQLDRLSEDERDKLNLATLSDVPVTVATGFELFQKDRHRIQERFKAIHPDLEINFRHKPNIVCGIVLETSEQIWAWNVANYLDELEELLTATPTRPAAEQSEIP